MKKLTLVFIFLFAGCFAARQTNTTINFGFSDYGGIAVLPFENLSNDIKAQEMLRKMVFKKFKKWGYNPLSLKEIDEKLRKNGITDGGQLNAVTLKTLKKILGSRAVCYGRIEDFTFQNLGFIVRRQVKLSVKMLNLSDGAVIYANTAKKKRIKIYISKKEAKKAFIRNSAEKLIENMFKYPLYKEAKAAVNKIFGKIPRR